MMSKSWDFSVIYKLKKYLVFLNFDVVSANATRKTKCPYKTPIDDACFEQDVEGALIVKDLRAT